MMVDNECGTCSDCIQAKLRAAQDAARNKKPTDTNPPCICQAETAHSTCPATKSYQEPLAWSLNSPDILDQSNSPLFTLVPREIRELIYTHALTDTTSYPVDRDRPEHPNPFARFDRFSQHHGSGGFRSHPSDIAFSLLFTCRAIYLETYTMPLRINAYIVGELSRQVKKDRFLAWQMAQIGGLDITLPQHSLENGALRNALEEWVGKGRHRGAYIVPMVCLRPGGRAKLEGFPQTFDNHCVLPAVKSFRGGPQRLVDVLHRLSIPEEDVLPCARDCRVALAQPLTHLTLRLTRGDWWTWSNAPSANTTRHLHLDPTFGGYLDGRPSNKLMRFRASERLAGRHPRFDPQCWGAHVMSLLPDLKTLQLVLETFKVKEEQLECVVNCAKTWRFNDDGEAKEKEKWVLVWDGEIVEKRWTKELGGLRVPRGAAWCYRCNDFEVRIVRYVKKRVED